MTLLLDTHSLNWILTDAERLREYSWLDHHCPLGGLPDLSWSCSTSPRSAGSSWMRMGSWKHCSCDPFDRLLAAHSATRRIPLCTVDRVLLEHHTPIVEALQ